MIYCRKYKINVGEVPKGFQQRPHAMKHGPEQIRELDNPIYSQLLAHHLSKVHWSGNQTHGGSPSVGPSEDHGPIASLRFK